MTDAGLYISPALTASWLPWLCLGMTMLVWLSCMLQPQYLRGLVSNSFATFTINAAEQVPSIGSQASQWLLNTTVPAIAVYTLVTQSAVYGTELFGMILLLSLLLDGLRALTAALVQYTFRLSNLMGLGYMRYFSLRSLFTFVLFVFTLLIAYTPWQQFWLVPTGIAAIIYLLTLGVQWSRLFCHSLPDVLGLLIYILTVEILPAILLYEAGRQLFLLQLT